MGKNKGRKIYKTKEKNYYGKSPLAKALSVGLTVLFIGGLGFIGYSIAEPIVNYSKKKGDDTAAVTTQSTTDEQNGSGSASVKNENSDAPEYRGYALRAGDMKDAETLRAALGRISPVMNVEYVEIPLKVTGGKVFYKSSLSYTIGAVQNELQLTEIVDQVERSGYKPAAVISAFSDSLLPSMIPQSGYVTYATGEQWIDNDLSAGGKPCTTPYSAIAVNYVADMITEACDAGFERIICSDISYPEFRQSDLDILPEELSSKKRFQALTSAANLFYDRAVSGGASMSVEVAADLILKDKADVITEPLYLNVKSLIISIDLDAISSGVYTDTTVYEFNGTAADKTARMLELLKDKLSGFSNVAVRLTGSYTATDEMLKAKEVIKDYGYTSFVIG